MTGLDALLRVDAATLDTGLSAENARAGWAAAIEGARRVDLVGELPGRAPSAVVIVASANVFTAPIEWAWALSQRGVRVILKSARGLAAVGEAIAEAMPGVEARDWRGGDLGAEAAALQEADCAMVFGSRETVAAIRARSPVPVLGFGPRFGVATVRRMNQTNAAKIALDHALYDGRGCMSPAAVFVEDREGGGAPPVALFDALGAMDARLPVGRISAAEEVDRRALLLLGRAVGSGWAVGSWIVVELLAERFEPRGLPRVVVLHPGAPSAATIRPWRAELGTIAVQRGAERDTRREPGLVEAFGLEDLPPARVCPVGTMQRPPGDRALHDGVDVLAAIQAADRH